MYRAVKGKTLLIFSILILGSITGCGSVVTLSESDAEIKKQLSDKRTRCIILPRVYSGVSYNICQLRADDNRSLNENPVTKTQGERPFIRFYVDSVASGIVDTIVLPYTVIQQNRRGSIELER